MNSRDTKKPTGRVAVRRVVEPPDPSEHLLERILSRANMQQAWKRVKANAGAPGVDHNDQTTFLGFAFEAGKIRWSDKAFKEFKRRIRKLTGRSWFVSMEDRLERLALCLRGWMNYFGISQCYQVIPEIDQWLRRRVHMCYWKQWRNAHTKVLKLLKLGTEKKTAILTAISGKGP